MISAWYHIKEYSRLRLIRWPRIINRQNQNIRQVLRSQLVSYYFPLIYLIWSDFYIKVEQFPEPHTAGPACILLCVLFNSKLIMRIDLEMLPIDKLLINVACRVPRSFGWLGPEMSNRYFTRPATATCFINYPTDN